MRVLVSLLMVMLVCSPVWAGIGDETHINSHNEVNVTHVTEVTEVTNVENNYSAEVDDYELGVGVDAKVYAFSDNVKVLDSVSVQARKDLFRKNMSEGYEAYLVLNLDFTK